MDAEREGERRATLTPAPDVGTPEPLRALQSRVDRLSSLIEVSALISSTLDLEALLALVMWKAQSVVGAEASCILLLNEETGKLEFEVALGEAEGTIHRLKHKICLDIGQGIAGSVAQTREPLLVRDVTKDPHFFAGVDAQTGFQTRSLIAAPLIVREKLIGVAEAMNAVDGREFTPEDLELFVTFCRQVAIAIENAKLHHALLERQRQEQQLAFASIVQQSFLPHAFPT